MITSEKYCGHCGAANDPARSTCFACRRSLAHMETGEPLLEGRYEIQTCVGTGGYGAVYRARDIQNPRRAIAIKQINLAKLNPQEMIEATDSFNREVELLSTLSNPHLPRIYDRFTDAEHWYVVMDFIDGETLDIYTQQQKAVSSGKKWPAEEIRALEEALEIGLQICDVLDYLHTREPAVIFRDLKPGNIMLTASKRVYLVDFGIARRFTPGKAHDTIPLGSPGYAAPEQYGKAQTTPRSDIYSLGAVLYFVLTSNDPADDPFHFSFPRVYSSAGTSLLQTLISSMVATSPDQRPASVLEIRKVLRQIAQQNLPTSSLLRQQVSPPSIPTPTATPWYTPGEGQQQQQQQQIHMPQTHKVSRRKVLKQIGVAGVVAGSGTIGWNAWNSYQANKDTLYTLKEHTDRVNAVAWSPTNRNLLASGSSDGTTRLWNMGYRRPFGVALRTVESSLSSEHLSLAWSPSGDHIAAIYASTLTLFSNAYTSYGTSYIAYENSSKDNFTVPPGTSLVAWSPDGKYLALAGADTKVLVWDVEKHEISYTYQSHLSTVTAIAWSPDSSRVVSGDASATIRRWGTNGDQLEGTDNSHRGSIQALAFSPDGQFIASSGSDDQSVQISLTSQLHPFYSYQEHTGMVNSIVWKSSGEFLASASSDGTVQIWNSPLVAGQNSAQRYVYHGHDGPVRSVSWSPNGRTLASGGDDKTVQIWRPDL